ncbi:MAG: methyltransferase GidB [Edaphobacter sp.]|jgi:16S rRNA (guanine527-N7)-methyltransferase|nr:methyltransferase GidB [Edaphobacter sp.]
MPTLPTLSESAIADLLIPYIPAPPASLYSQLSQYLDLLLKWNARTNLTAIRDPEEIVRRHFGESLFAAQHLGSPETLLDLGSGAGFPGLPIALLHPAIQVTLAESQNKKATFLREAVRTLSLRNIEVWAARVETMPSTRRFHTVTLRAVDNMAAAIAAAAPRATHQLLLLTGTPPPLPPDFTPEPSIPIPNTQVSILLRATRP